MEDIIFSFKYYVLTGNILCDVFTGVTAMVRSTNLNWIQNYRM